ncbi:hypothetical protein GGF46_003844 [Coemansia sp. RSA 552]|nr:hypothetical protein GGF46_003844 [Coemansia sp. RSA 552]
MHLGLLVGLCAAAACGAYDWRQRPLLPSESLGPWGLEQWMYEQDTYARGRILGNIAPFPRDSAALPGAVCASPSRSHPDYYYSWTRDSALVMLELLSWPDRGNGTIPYLDDYVGFTRHVQGQESRYGLGEAKFYMDGSLFTKSWCNAQTDGPAIRARALIKYLWHLQQHHLEYQHLYGRGNPITTDLEYVMEVWAQNTSCDIWEESRGSHFYTLVAQQRALQEGAQVARALFGDWVAARRYEAVARAIGTKLQTFWDPRREYIVATLDKSGGIQSKHSNLDMQVVLAILHHEGEWKLGMSEVAATVLKLLRVFEPMYAINQAVVTVVNGRRIPIGIAVGRYPEDVYNGDGTSRGNPWTLITSAVAEYHYRLGLSFANAGRAELSSEMVELLQWTGQFHQESLTPADSIAQGTVLNQGDRAFGGLLKYLRDTGDLYMGRVFRHTDSDHTMYEQWRRSTGFGTGAVHLTWSYAAHTAAVRARSSLSEHLVNPGPA